MTAKTFFKGMCGMVAAVAFTACSGKDSIEGSWVEPIPGMENMVQGVCLEKRRQGLVHQHGHAGI